MSIDPDKLDTEVLTCIASNLDMTPDDRVFRAKVARMSEREAFERYCNWHGLIGWSRDLINAIDNIRTAEIPND